MHDRHMHERGFLADIEHDEIGPITVPTSPLRFHGAPSIATGPLIAGNAEASLITCGA